MRVLFFSAGTDIAGLCHGMKTAFDRHAPGWKARSVARLRSPYGYASDAKWSEMIPLARRADIIHVMDNPVRLIPNRRTGLVVEHVGSRYRRNPDRMDRRCRALNAMQVTAGLDFAGLPWLPPVVDIDALARLRVEHWQPSNQIRIVHAPTNRTLKSTDIIERVVARLAKRYPIDFEIVEGRPWAECLVRKAQADILVDELTYGYGLNALECWAMGMPVVSGIADPVVRDRMCAEFGALPFVDANPDDLEQKLEVLIADPALAADWGQHGLAHAIRFHSERAVVERTLDLYARAA